MKKTKMMAVMALMALMALIVTGAGVHASQELPDSPEECYKATYLGGGLSAGCLTLISAAAIACPINLGTGFMEPISAVACWGSLGAAALSCSLSIPAILAMLFQCL